MNSALKPVLPQPGVPQSGGQASPAKGNVVSANHAVGLPQGAQNSLHHGSNNLAVQNLTQHVNIPPLPLHAAPSMAPVTANMAQMAQNMSHHGNLSHITQNSVTPANVAASPSKSASTSAPLSLVQDKANTSQPLALTRTPEKKEPDSTGPTNGTIESPKSASNAPTTLKPQNPEPKQEKQDIAKTSPSTPKPPEKANTPNTPQKPESSNPSNQPDSPTQPKVATATEVPEKSPSKPSEIKPAADAEIAPSQSDSKPIPESANDNQQEPSPQKEPAEDKPEPAKEEKELEKPPSEEKKEEKVEAPKQEETPQKVEKVEEKKVEVKPVTKAESKVLPKSTLKLATVTPPMRKRRQPSEKLDGATPAKKAAESDGTPDTRIKRNRTKVQLYQSPTPEIAMATKLSASAGRSTPTKQNDDKLIVFYKNEYLAVRNAEGGFYVCQAVQNVYRTTRKIKIRWLSQEKSDSSGETYKPDFYDVTDMECVLTTLSLSRGSGGTQILKEAERARAQSILERALRAEQSGANSLHLTEEHPDGLDLSLYTDESQLEKKTRKRNSSKSSRGADATETAKEEATPIKKSRTPKRSPKSVTKAKPKRQGSTPTVAPSSKVGIVRRIYRNTATALTEKGKAKTPTKKTPVKPAKVETPVSTPRGRRAAKENKPTPVVPTPSTSTGKTSRTRRQIKK